MCRILTLSAKPGSTKEYVEFIHKFIDASENDVYLQKISSRKSHGDGWGLAAIGLTDGEPVVIFHKTILPIYHDLSRDEIELFIERMNRYDQLYLLLHARLSSRREPYGERYTHPFEVLYDDLAIWFIHNGGVDKKELGKTLGLNPIYYTDSWIAAYYIAKYLRQCIVKPEDMDNCVVRAYDELLKYTLSALNTGLLLLYGNNIRLYTSYYLSPSKRGDENLINYYQLHYLKLRELASIGSSTLKHYIDKRLESLEMGLYRLEPGDIATLKNYE